MQYALSWKIYYRMHERKCICRSDNLKVELSKSSKVKIVRKKFKFKKKKGEKKLIIDQWKSTNRLLNFDDSLEKKLEGLELGSWDVGIADACPEVGDGVPPVYTRCLAVPWNVERDGTFRGKGWRTDVRWVILPGITVQAPVLITLPPLQKRTVRNAFNRSDLNNKLLNL